MEEIRPAVWFPTVRTRTGTDVFTESLVAGLRRRGFYAEVTWLPHRAEYAPWTLARIDPPSWANVVHANSWLHSRFIPRNVPLVVTVHHCVHDPFFSPYKSLAQKLYHRVWIRNLELEMLNRADVVTTVSRYSVQSVERAFGRNEIQVIYNWVDTDSFLSTHRAEAHHPFRLLFVGSKNRRKGVDLLPRLM